MNNPKLPNVVLPTVPKPPQKTRIKDQRSFVKLLTYVCYLLDGVEEFDEEGNLVDPWREGNIYLWVKPLVNEDYLNYYKLHGESIDKTVSLLLGFEYMTYQRMADPENTPAIELDEFNGHIIPGVGTLYGDFNIIKNEVCSYILSCNGKIVGKDTVTGKFLTEAITPEQINKVLPHGFATTVIDNETQETVWHEILRVSTVFNTDLVAEELKKDGELKEDELKNSPPKKEISKSDAKPSKTRNAKPE